MKAKLTILLASVLATGIAAGGAAAEGRSGAVVVAQAPVEDGIAVTRQRPEAILRADEYQIPPRFAEERAPMIIADLEAQPIYTRAGENIGTVDRLVQGPDGERWIVFEHGGVLGFGAEKLALPQERFYVEDGRLFVWGVTQEDIERMEGIDQAWGEVPAIQDTGPFGMNLGETGYRTE